MLNSNQALSSLQNCKRRINILYFKHLHTSCILHPRKPASKKKANDLLSTSHSNGSDVIYDHNMQINGYKNFYGVEGDEGVINVEEISRVGELTPDINIIKPMPKPREFRFTSFGAVRLDVENKPLYVPIELKNKRNNKSLKFNTMTENNLKSTLSENKFLNNSNKYKNSQLQYFNSVNKTENPDSSNGSDKDCISNNNLKLSSYADENSLQNNAKCNYIDSLYFPPESNDQYRNSPVNEQKQQRSDSNSVSAIKEYPNQTMSDSTKKTTASAYEDSFCDIKCLEEKSMYSKGQIKINSSQNQPAASDSKINQFPIEKSAVSRQAPVSYIDQFYFPEESLENSMEENKKHNLSYIDEQYFDEFKTTQHINSCNVKKNNLSSADLDAVKSSTISKINLNNDTSPNAEINDQDKRYFIKKTRDIELPSEKSAKFKLANNENFVNYNIHKELSDKLQKNHFSFKTNFMSDNPNYKLQKNSKSEKVPPNENLNIEKKSTELLNKNMEKSNSESQPEMAYDFVKKLREKKFMSEEVKKGISAKKEKKLDSKGFRILKHQVPSLQYFTRDEILELLKENILHIDEDIVVLNKPYNLVIHESNTTKDAACLSMYLDDMANMLDQRNNSPKLFTVHRLDKETTGCLLLARNDITAQRLKSLFSQRKIIKTYWIVTSKIPDPMEGVIDIPISEGKIENKARMVLHPDLPSDIHYKNHSKPGKRAVTRYKVIATSGSAALVEVQPETGLKHQIRVHFGLGLSCPILGDHKYSYLDKLVPQKLASDLLQRLRVRQSKVRHIPLHIHSKHILIPQFSEGRNLFITAPLPKHMSENLRSLKFRKK